MYIVHLKQAKHSLWCFIKLFFLVFTNTHRLSQNNTFFFALCNCSPITGF